MHEAKNTQRSLVKIGFDGTVRKTFRGPDAETRYANEVRVLKHLAARNCPFVPRLLEQDDAKLEIVTTNCGAIVQHLGEQRANEIFAELDTYGVRHDDPYPRNITYRASDGRFCVIDFEFAEITDGAAPDLTGNTASGSRPSPAARSNQLAWSGCTDRGRFRPNNEDSFLAMLLDRNGIRYLGKTGTADLRECDFIFAVSDGMGGARSGEFASRIAIEKITLLLPKQFSLSQDRFQAYAPEILGELFDSIHSAMINLGKYDSNCQDMGATLTLIWVRQDRIYFGHIGDSRLYHLPESDKISQVTEDHSHVGWMRRNGKLNEREARMHPRKNVLAQALGAGHQFLNPHMGVLDYSPGDRFLLCSDGLNEGLWDHHIEELVREDVPDCTPTAAKLVEKAVAASGRDNATAVVIQAMHA